jgi:hypothetical protein
MPDVAALVTDLTRLVAVSTRTEAALEACLRALAGAFELRFAGLYRLDPSTDGPMTFAGALAPPTGLTPAGLAVALGRVGCIALDETALGTCLCPASSPRPRSRVCWRSSRPTTPPWPRWSWSRTRRRPCPRVSRRPSGR